MSGLNTGRQLQLDDKQSGVVTTHGVRSHDAVTVRIVCLLHCTFTKWLLMTVIVCHSQTKQVCGKGPATTSDLLEGVLFEGVTNSQPLTVQGAFRQCSYGNADFSKASGVQVLSVTVPIPCKGTTGWVQYDSSTCPYVGE